MGDEEADPSFQLSDKRFVTVRKYGNSVLVDIREFYDKGGEKLPGRKGISLTAEQFRALYEQAPEISKAIEEAKTDKKAELKRKIDAEEPIADDAAPATESQNKAVKTETE